MAEASLAVYRPLGLSWEIAASLLLGAFASIILGDTAGATRAADEAVRLLTPIDDSWGFVHAEGMLGAIARADHRFGDAAGSFSRAASASERLGFLGQAALHMANLGRVEQLAGHDAAVDTLSRAIQLAGSSGDLRLAATARINLARELLASADALATELLHVVYDIDRVDARRARSLIAADVVAVSASPGP